MENKIPIIAISGVSGAGKGSVCSCLKNISNIEFSISYATRGKRLGEENGREYWFISNAEFDQAVKNGEFLEWEEVHKDRYGTKEKDLENILSSGKIPLLDIEYKGVGNVKKIFSNVVTVFITVSSINVAMERLRNRGTETESEMELRIKRYAEEMSQQNNYDYIIVNDELKRAQDELLKIVSSLV